MDMPTYDPGHVQGTGKYAMARSGTEPANSEAGVRIGTLLALPSILQNLGANPAEILAEAGFDLAQFDDPDNRIAYAARTGCQHLGLLIGQQVGLHSLGLVGMLVKYSPDVGTALRNLVHFQHLHVRGAVTDLETDGDSAILRYEIYQPGTRAIDQVGDGAVAAMFNMLRALCGPGWKATEVRFAHRKPGDVLPFRSFFRAPLVFDAEQNAVVFAAGLLNHPLPETDPALRRLLLKEIDAIDVRHGDVFPGQVRSVLRTAIVTGQARSDQVAGWSSRRNRSPAWMSPLPTCWRNSTTASTQRASNCASPR
jgi:hypothetical protein